MELFSRLNNYAQSNTRSAIRANVCNSMNVLKTEESHIPARCFLDFNKHVTTIDIFSNKIYDTDFSKILITANASSDVINKCNDEKLKLRLSWSNWTDTKADMVICYDYCFKSKKDIEDYFSDAIGALDILVEKSDKNAKLKLDEAIYDINLKIKSVIKKTNSAISSNTDFNTKFATHAEMYESIIDSFKTEKGKKNTELDDVKKKIADIKKDIDAYNAGIIASAIAMGITPVVGAISIALGAAAVVVFPIMIIAFTGAMTALIILSEKLKQKQAELITKTSEKDKLDADITLLETGVSTIESISGESSKLSDSISKVCKPWEALLKDMEAIEVLVNQKNVSYKDLHDGFKKASETWTNLMIDMNEMSILNINHTTQKITIENISTESSITNLLKIIAA